MMSSLAKRSWQCLQSVWCCCSTDGGCCPRASILMLGLLCLLPWGREGVRNTWRDVKSHGPKLSGFNPSFHLVCWHAENSLNSIIRKYLPGTCQVPWPLKMLDCNEFPNAFLAFRWPREAHYHHLITWSSESDRWSLRIYLLFLWPQICLLQLEFPVKRFLKVAFSVYSVCSWQPHWWENEGSRNVWSTWLSSSLTTSDPPPC